MPAAPMALRIADQRRSNSRVGMGALMRSLALMTAVSTAISPLYKFRLGSLCRERRKVAAPFAPGALRPQLASEGLDQLVVSRSACAHSAFPQSPYRFTPAGNTPRAWSPAPDAA